MESFAALPDSFATGGRRVNIKEFGQQGGKKTKKPTTPHQPKPPQKEGPVVTLIISGSASVSPVRRFLVFWNRRRLYLLITGRKERFQLHAR